MCKQGGVLLLSESACVLTNELASKRMSESAYAQLIWMCLWISAVFRF